MKVTGFLVALAAAGPMASAIPFRMSDFLAPAARAPAPVEAPQEFAIRSAPTNITTRATNLTVRSSNLTAPAEKRAFLPQGSEGHAERSLHNGVVTLDRRSNITFKA